MRIYVIDLPFNPFYQKLKDPNLYKPGRLIALVKSATNGGIAICSGNNGWENHFNNLLSNITMIKPIQESYYNHGHSINLEFNISSLMIEQKLDAYTIVVVLEHQKYNISSGGSHSLFYYGKREILGN